ncbi:MAG: MFS transporter [Acidimicrobiia bacterium]|nr:MFS transporter [Acidimicrobiia bacterium]
MDVSRAAGSTAPARRQPSGVRHGFRAFEHRDFRRFWSGALVSNSGTWLQNITLPVVLLEITGQAFWTGIATFAGIFPSMLLGPLAGNLADRFERRKLLIAGQTGAALSALMLWIVWISGVREPAAIVGVAAFTGIFGAFTIPAWQSFIPLLVPIEDLPSAISMNSLQFNAARGIGPALGGLILAFAGPSWAFLGNSLSYGAVLVALLLVRPAQTRQVTVQRKVGRGFVEAIRYIRTQPGITVGIGLAAVVAFLGFPLLNFAAVFVQQVYEVDRGYVGLLAGLLGAGAVMAVPVVSGMFGDLRRAAVIGIAVPFYGLAIIVFGSSTTVAQGAAGLLLAGTGFMMIVVTSNTAVQSIVNEQIRGRVMAIRIMTFTGSFPVGALVQTRLSDATSPRPVVTSAGAIVLAIELILTLTQRRRLAHLDDPPDTRTDLTAVIGLTD